MTDAGRVALGNGVVGREAELGLVTSFLDGDARCLVLVGDAGIGKTTLWECGVAAAADRGVLVLSARASEAETGLSFAGLTDLVDCAPAEELAGLPGPQLHAVEVALRRAEPTGTPAEPVAIALGFLGMLRSDPDREILVAIDDVTWLDSASAEVVVFAARRLAGSPVRFLLSRRPGKRSSLELALEPVGVDDVAVRSLSLGAISRLLSDRVDLVLPRRVLRQVFDAAQGNPLYALELGRAVAAAGLPEAGSELPLPDVIDDVFGDRVEALARPVREALLAVCLSPNLSRPELVAIADDGAVDEAVASGLLVADPSRFRPAHPMVAVAVRRHSDAAERRAMHQRLSDVGTDPILRCRHLAISTTSPTPDVVAEIVAASALARERGAIHDAEELAAHALRLTADDDLNRSARVLALARYHEMAGDTSAADRLLRDEIGGFTRGRLKAHGYLLLGQVASLDEEERYLVSALAEAGDDPDLRAVILARRSILLSINRVERLAEAEEIAEQALAAARFAGGDTEVQVLYARSWARIMRGRPVDEPDGTGDLPPIGTEIYETSLDRAFAVGLAFRGLIREAAAIFDRLLSIARDRGEFWSTLVMQVQLAELGLRAGRVDDVRRQLEHIDFGTRMEDPMMIRTRMLATLAATTGDPAQTRQWAGQMLDTKDLSACPGWDRLEATRAMGLGALFEHDYDRAASNLGEVWQHTVNEQVDDPGAFPVAADLVEAMIGLGDVDAATKIAGLLRVRSEEQEHPWGLVTAERCDVMVRATSGLDADDSARLSSCAATYGQLGLGFDQARTLLILGRLQRRSNQRRAARRALAEAAAVFDELGCHGWAAQARTEAERVSGRRAPAPHALTPSEARVAALAAAGRSNKQIAAQLSVSVYTVEAHLRHAYTKLGIGARAQLTAALEPN